MRFNWNVGLLAAAFLILAGTIMAVAYSANTPASGDRQNISFQNGQQVISLVAKGGYRPRTTLARANVATTLNVETQGTFDCSSALVIPALSYRTNLQPSGVTAIPIPPQAPGTVLQGLCAMGMYSFQIKFS